jgi:SIR2-like domain
MDWKESAIQEVFEKRFPTVLLGSGASISTSQSLGLATSFPSMADLAKRYSDSINPVGFEVEDMSAYLALSDELKGLGAEWHKFNLEGFLSEHPLKHNSVFLGQILAQTSAAFITPHEELASVFEQNPDVNFPLKEMLVNLLRAAPAANPELCVITPNYDLLVEYASDLIGVPCLTGFCGGILRMWKPEIGTFSPMLRKGGKAVRAKNLRLIKPHGSFSWHQSVATPERVVECFKPNGLEGNWQRCMIVPGPTKYAEALRDVRREHLHYMDHAFKAALSLLIIGYGFNDQHLEAHLKQSVDRGTPTLCVTYSLSEEVRQKFIEPHPNVTCITCDGADGTIVQIGAEKKHYPGEDIWKLDRFVTEFTR